MIKIKNWKIIEKGIGPVLEIENKIKKMKKMEKSDN